MAENVSKICMDEMLAGLGPALFASIRAPFGIFDKDYRIVWINKAMAAIHKVEAEKVDLNSDVAITVKLSRRESDVLRLITEGYTNTQISELLDISTNAE